MLMIRRQQMEALQHQKDQTFVRWMAAQIRLEHSLRTSEISDADLERIIHTGVLRGRSHDLHESSMLMTFIDGMFRFHRDYDLHPEIRSLLDDRTCGPDERIMEAIACAASRTWEPE